MATAVLSAGLYRAGAPQPVGSAGTLLARVSSLAGDGGSALVGFDFPIGIPRRYAEAVGITDFKRFLGELGTGRWKSFYEVAEHPDEICLERPFYPRRPGGTEQAHLLRALGVARLDDLRRRCEMGRLDRRAASPLFWTLGGQQVGKAAISGWRDALSPVLCDPAQRIALWPFDGSLWELLAPGVVVVAETYPAEFYRHLSVSFPPSRAGQQSGKRVQADRRANAGSLLQWASELGVHLSPELRSQIEDGFGASPDAEDAFDATIGLFGMLNVLLGKRTEGMPDDDPPLQMVEGWILGQDGGPGSVAAGHPAAPVHAPTSLQTSTVSTAGQWVEGRLDLIDPAHGGDDGAGHLHAFTATNARGNSILLGSTPAGPEEAASWTGVSPMEVVLLGLGGCTGIDVASTLRKMRQEVTSYRIGVRGERRDEHPRVYTRIVVEHELHGRGLRESAVRRAIALSAGKYCSVSAMLEQAARVEISYRLLDDATGTEIIGTIPVPVALDE
jgi:uncharacterized OsmC-like protein